MKFLSYKTSLRASLWGLGALLTVFTAACSDDMSQSSQDPGSSFLSTPLNISISVSTQGRPNSRATWTDTEGDSTKDDINKAEVAATDEENRIFDAYICFVDHNEGNLLLMLPTDERYPSADQNVTLTHEVATVNELFKIYGKEVDVYVIANTEYTSLDYNFNFKTTETGGKNPKNSTFTTGSFSGPIGVFGENGKALPLINHDNTITIQIGGNDSDDDDTKIANLKALFSRLQDGDLWWDLKDDTTNTTVLNLERAVARIEYKDLTREAAPTPDPEPEPDPDSGSEPETGASTRLANKYLPYYTYWIGDHMNVMLKLYSLQPFNVNKTAYFFRHTIEGNAETANGPENLANHNLFGFERGNVADAYNWIANPDWSNYNSETHKFTSRSFLNPLTVSATKYTITSDGCEVTIPELEKAKKSGDLYYPFCYVMENTVPDVEVMSGKKSIDNTPSGKNVDVPLILDYATGVAFKFLVLDNTGLAPFTNKTDASLKPAEFSWSSESGETDHLIITDLETQQWVDVAPVQAYDENGDELVDDEGNPVYHYYLTYVAPIEHNNPERLADSDLPPMFYGVVRNNSYQLRVNSVVDLPLPQDPRTIHLQIDCQVRDWNVRWDENATLY